jgi:AAA15 family ATPase/GTPase
MLGIASQEGGCVLIDEIENGFYYERLTAIWKALYAIAVVSRCQLFVTTHSQECLRSLLPVLEESGKHFSLLKTERVEGNPRVFVSAGEVMTAAIQSGFELR